jgi:queuine tRNA-ribosyltransferase
MNWKRPLLTDSGGNQVFSLQEKRKISEEGVTFQSHVDGAEINFTPEIVIQAEKVIGADIIMAFDDCAPHPCTRDQARDAMRRTHNWLTRSVESHQKEEKEQALFGIIQGSIYGDLRKESMQFVCNAGTDGIAVGGLSVGEPIPGMYRILDHIKDDLPPEKPHYLMGVGFPENIVEGVTMGMDMFDCIVPTRHARNGQVFTSKGRLHYKAGAFKECVDRPLDEACACFVCKNYSLGYLRYLFSVGEITALRLATYHNLYFYLNMMKSMRQAILDDAFNNWKKAFLKAISC